jgi:hypothetical protein
MLLMSLSESIIKTDFKYTHEVCGQGLMCFVNTLMILEVAEKAEYLLTS